MIGVFDSGLGGLGAYKALCMTFPHEDMLYYADTAHLPIGMRSEAEIVTLVEKALHFFEERRVRAVLLACGTASAIALEKCKEKFAFPLFGIVEPGARAACAATQSGRIAVAATPATIKSHVFSQSILRYLPHAFVSEHPCPSLVMLAEDEKRGLYEIETVCQALAPICHENVDTLILGCTHFPLLSESIRAVLPTLSLIDPAKEAVAAMARTLPAEKEKKTGEAAHRYFCATRDPMGFAAHAMAVTGLSLTPCPQKQEEKERKPPCQDTVKQE